MNIRKIVVGAIISFIIVIIIPNELLRVYYEKHEVIDYKSECSFFVKNSFIMNGGIFTNEEYILPLARNKQGDELYLKMNRGDKIFKETNSNIIYLIEDFDSTAYYFSKRGD